MQFINSKTPQEGIDSLASRICNALKANQKVLWLISGGSNIPIAVQTMKIIREQVSRLELNNLTITLTDERFGPVGHKDSNWKQIEDAGFDFDGIEILPVLQGLNLEQTTETFSENIEKAFKIHNFIIAQFGIGPDGHIAGVLPHSEAVKNSKTAFSYEAKPFTRITLTLKAISNIPIAYAFVFGESKREAIENLKTKELTLEEQPAQVLKGMKKVYFYSDVKGSPRG